MLGFTCMYYASAGTSFVFVVAVGLVFAGLPHAAEGEQWKANRFATPDHVNKPLVRAVGCSA
jgi:hypothetical protein